MSDIFVIGGTTLDPTTHEFLPIRFSERFGTIPTLTIQRRGIALPGLPDPWVGQVATWRHGGTLYFTGDVVSLTPNYSQKLGWVLTYQCLGWRNRLDWFAHTDSLLGTDTSAYNLTLEDAATNPAYLSTRTGRNVGQILTDVLTMQTNANAISAAGIGNYTGLPTTPTLPASTVSDLASLTIIPPQPVYFTGEKFGGAVDGFLAQWAPNIRFWIDPSGNMRFMDVRTFSATTLTMGTDPIEPSELSRDIGDCFGRVVVRGQPIAVMQVLKQSLGDITQNFAHDGLTNSAAISAWTPSQFRQPGTAQDSGNCTATSTTTLNLTSSSGSNTWTSGALDQSHGQYTINLRGSTITDFTQFWSARIVANGATSGGITAVTIDNPLPSLNYDSYTISGLATGGSVVWTQYQVNNHNLWPRVTRQSTYPQPFINAGGGVTEISSALGCVLWSNSGTAPFNSFPLAFTFNSTTGNIRFIAPTYFIANNAPPADVWVAVPVFTNPNTATEPPDVGGVAQYTGTSHTVDGATKTLTIQADFWRDPSQLSQMQAYASDVLDSVKNAYVEGSVVYYGFYTAALTFGMNLNINGNDGTGAYTTGWDTTSLPGGVPVVQVDMEWPQDEGVDYKVTMHVSNRFAHYSASVFLHPAQQFLPLGTADGIYNPYGVAQPGAVSGEATGNYQAFNDFLAENPGAFNVGLSTGNQTAMGATDLSGIATDPGSYMESMGPPTAPEDLGLPMTPGDLGLPTDPGSYMKGAGLPRAPAQALGEDEEP